MDYFELNVINPENIGNKSKLFFFLKKAAIVCMIVAVALILILLPWKNAGLNIFYNILIILMIELPLFGAFIVFSRICSKYYDLDYFIIGDTFKIVKIINKSERKSILEVNLFDIDKVGLVGDKEYAKLVGDGVEQKSYACNSSAETFLFALLTENGERKLCTLDYDDKFVLNLRKALKREAVFDTELLLEVAKRNKEDKK